ncbi:MAG TPA: signal peptidase II [Xanthobacteraceae bacterium]|nr:signal peptidase II [Xanthobacteraceae bacterium]
MSHYLVAMLAAVLVAAADQASKAVALARWPVPATVPVAFVAIRCVLNRRGALAPIIGARALVALWVAAVALSVAALAYMPGHGALAAVGIGAVVGGATGNLLDRLRRGAVPVPVRVALSPTLSSAQPKRNLSTKCYAALRRSRTSVRLPEEEYGKGPGMSATLIVLVPLVLLALVTALCFVGCAFPTSGLAMKVLTNYRTVDVLGNPNLAAFWPLDDAANSARASELKANLGGITGS